MVPRLKISPINVNISLEDAASLVFRESYSRYPVYDKSLDEIIGILYAKDILQHFVEKSGKTLFEIMRKAYYITENKRIDHLLREFLHVRIARILERNFACCDFGGVGL